MAWNEISKKGLRHALNTSNGIIIRLSIEEDTWRDRHSAKTPIFPFTGSVADWKDHGIETKDQVESFLSCLSAVKFCKNT